MKKVISLVLLLSLCLGMLVGCVPPIIPQPTEPSTPTDPTTPTVPESYLNNAKTILFNQYKPANKDEIPAKYKDFELMTNVMAVGDNHSVTWTVVVTSGAADAVKIVENATPGYAQKVDLTENPENDILFTLTATISDPYGNSESLSFNFKVPAYVAPSIAFVKNPEAGKAYKLVMQQTQLDGRPYLGITGEMSGYYFETSDDMTKMVDVYMEAVEGGYRLYHEKDGTKIYINVVPRDGEENKVNIKYQTATENATPSVYKLNSEFKYIYTSQVGSEWYLGTYGTNKTVSASNTSYIKDTSLIGNSQFCAWFAAEDENACKHTGGTATCTELPVCSKCGEAYGEMLDHSYNAEHNCSVCGEHDPKHALNLSIPAAKEQKDGQMVIISGTVTAIDEEWSSYNNMSVIITDADGNTMLVHRMTTKVVLGDIITVTGPISTYKDAKQIGKGGTAEVTGHDDSIVPPETTAPTTEPTTAPTTEPSAPATEIGVVAAPVAGTAYKFGMVQGNLNKTFYLKGGMNGYYMDTTEDINSAIDVYLEATEGGYYLYCMVDGTKTYINTVVSGTHVNGAYEATASTVYVYDAASKTLKANVDGSDYWFGTRNDNTYTTVGPCKVSYNGFYCQFYGEVAVNPDNEPTTEPTTAPTTEPENPGTDSAATYTKITSASQFTSGTYVMIVSTGYAPTTITSANSPWVNCDTPVVNGNVVTDTKGAVWTITVSGTSVTLTDANGKTIAPKGGNNNGIKNDSYNWDWVCNANGTFTFKGVGSDTVTLASNTDMDAQYGGLNRFRGYKNTSIAGDSAKFRTEFTLYKLIEA